MGDPNVNDGSIERADLNGLNRKVIVPAGRTFTPKQIHLDKKNGKLYWCDREGMRVMCSNLDGSKIETLTENGKGDVDRRDVMKCVCKRTRNFFKVNTYMIQLIDLSKRRRMIRQAR